MKLFFPKSAVCASLTLYALLTGRAEVIAAPSSSSTNLAIEAGYHVIYSYSGTDPPSGLLDLIREGVVGGIILFGDNVVDDLSSVVDSFQDAYSQSPQYAGSPLLILTDQEGGQVRRLPGGPQLSELDIGSSSNPTQAATLAGSQAYQAFANTSVNGNLAPVLDVYRQKGDFIDEYERSYGNDSSVVSECGAAFITEQQSLGAVATAKHFPGLGAALAGQNTDEEPVTIGLSLSELRDVDEAAYAQPIRAGVQMVMASWALYPALDGQYPSGLSEKWIQGELRGRLAYKGVTISDAIEAGALRNFGSDQNRAVLASKAGLDVILAAARDYTQGKGIVDAFVEALQNGTLSQEDFGEATQRILSLRESLK